MIVKTDRRTIVHAEIVWDLIDKGFLAQMAMTTSE